MEVLRPQPTQCPLCVRIRAARPPQPSRDQAASLAPAPCLEGPEGRKHPEVQGPPEKPTGQDEQPDVVWHPCAEGGPDVGVQSQPHKVALQQGKGELTFLMMFVVSLSRNSWALLASFSAVFVCA